MTTALVADDEPLLRSSLVSQLAEVWPKLEVVAQARNGREAIELYDIHKPDVCFLDIKMPGISGLEAAKEIGNEAHIVFVTAFDRYAVDAFEAGVLDYLVKPVKLARLSETAKRLRHRISANIKSTNGDLLIEELSKKLRKTEVSDYLSWVKVRVGTKIHIVAVEDIAFFQSHGKYTRLIWWNETAAFSEGLIRSPLKTILKQLDPKIFQPIHRSAIVNLAHVKHVVRNDNDTGNIHLKRTDEILPVSRANINRFKAMR